MSQDSIDPDLYHQLGPISRTNYSIDPPPTLFYYAYLVLFYFNKLFLLYFLHLTLFYYCLLYYLLCIPFLLYSY